MLIDTLAEVAGALNREDVRWGVGGSVLLQHFGLESHPHDIDIMVAEKDADGVALVLDGLGIRRTGAEQGSYVTFRFLEYVVDGTDIDVMAGFGIRHSAGIYLYAFDERAVTDSMPAGTAVVPLTALEDWYVLYQLMAGREQRIRVIEDYLTAMGSAHVQLLERALEQRLPPDVRSRTERLLLTIAQNAIY
jgi:hypothetical protein